ncbi:MAG: hypothetical protein OXC83_09645 [Chloroflexi bacterium]|nr:hypothetical protein [Chloroflexota bacterium]
MQAKKKRLTLDMDPAFQRRLKATAALKGVSMREYCLSAIDRELDEDQLDEDKDLSSATPASNQYTIVRRGFKGDMVLTGDSVEVLKKAREVRDAEIEADGKANRQSGRFGIGEVIALRKELFGDRVFPGHSADLLREARAIRDAEIEGWA